MTSRLRGYCAAELSNSAIKIIASVGLVETCWVMLPFGRLPNGPHARVLAQEGGERRLSISNAPRRTQLLQYAPRSVMYSTVGFAFSWSLIAPG